MHCLLLTLGLAPPTGSHRTDPRKTQCGARVSSTLPPATTDTLIAPPWFTQLCNRSAATLSLPNNLAHAAEKVSPDTKNQCVVAPVADQARLPGDTSFQHTRRQTRQRTQHECCVGTWAGKDVTPARPQQGLTGTSAFNDVSVLMITFSHARSTLKRDARGGQ